MSGVAGSRSPEPPRPTDAALVDRLAALPHLDAIPRHELEWIVARGRYEAYEAGTVIAALGHPIETLWVILSGRITIRVDRGAGPRHVITWLPGDVTGMLPYSRMTGPPGDNRLEARSELLTLHQDYFPELIHQCPVFTAYTVHLMLDRARSFKASDLQDEKLVSLGKLAAGLAHELNNPASALVRSAQILRAGLTTSDAAVRAISTAGLTPEQLDAIEGIRSACLAIPTGDVLSPIQRADREDEIADWLARHGADPAHTEPLAETPVTLHTLDELAGAIPADGLDAVLGWIAAGCSAHALARDIERAATRIHELVAAVKRFTYMDRLPAPEPVDVEAGLRDTIRVVASKARSKGATVTLDVDPDLPRVQAIGGELNQVWLNLVDNALDAVAEQGRVEITVQREADRVVVRVVDDGPGIPPDVMHRIFDPFFTTKPPGEGTGMGLEIARRILRRHRGDITVESRPGRTEMRVRLPADTGDASPPDGGDAPLADTGDAPPTGTGDAPSTDTRSPE